MNAFGPGAPGQPGSGCLLSRQAKLRVELLEPGPKWVWQTILGIFFGPHAAGNLVQFDT